jgi:hypothetical protein
MNEPYRDNAADLRAAKMREDAETERVRIQQSEETKRTKIKEAESTRRSRGDGWLAPWIASAIVIFFALLLGYYAYIAKLDSNKVVPPVQCQDAVYEKGFEKPCTPGAIGHIEGNFVVCTCIRPYVVEKQQP